MVRDRIFLFSYSFQKPDLKVGFLFFYVYICKTIKGGISSNWQKHGFCKPESPDRNRYSPQKLLNVPSHTDDMDIRKGVENEISKFSVPTSNIDL